MTCKRIATSLATTTALCLSLALIASSADAVPVESKPVEKAMVRVAHVLEAWTEGPAPPALAEVARGLRDACDLPPGS